MPLRVFITGASSGVGEALARHYAMQGARLGLFARREEILRALQGEFGTDRCRVYAGDVRDAARLARAAGDFIAHYGAPDVVIANAGVSRGTLTERAEDLAVFEDVLAVNVMGIANTFAPFIAAMRAAVAEGRHPVLAGIASIAGFRGLPGSSAYSASKAAAISYLESLRVELRASGIAVSTICPGYIATPMTEKNPYPMPFRLSAPQAAGLIVRAIARRKKFYVLPWPMALIARVLKVLPRSLYDALFARAPHKPRGLI
jgi:short-subunit dehydrogenase